MVDHDADAILLSITPMDDWGASNQLPNKHSNQNPLAAKL